MTQQFSKVTETSTAAADEWVGDHSQVPGKAIDEDTYLRWRYLSGVAASNAYTDTWPVVLTRP